jgi:cysteinyl-tRNA synthetase, unknown class
MIKKIAKEINIIGSQMPVFRLLILLLFAAAMLLIPVACSKGKSNALPLTLLLLDDGPPADNYRQSMRDFVQGISAYARGIDPGFIVIPQNGIELITDTGETTGTPVGAYLDAISGVGQEDLYYGYTADNVATPSATTNYLKGYLNIALTNGKQVMAIDYCSTTAFVDNSYSSNNTDGYISFAADHRDLDNIPAYPASPYSVNTDDITTLTGAKNFLYLINPSAYTTKADFLTAIKDTNYDIVLIDLFFNDGSELSAAEIDSLKKKKTGESRLVICYMSIGEAENYRYYWVPGWRPGIPAWLGPQNPSWPGNYKVRYWNPDWQTIIYGNDTSYLKKITDAGFDGVYLDIIDAFEYWESR